MRVRNLLLIGVVSLLAASAASAQNQDCSCTGVQVNPALGCGNGGIGGNQGDIFTAVTPADVQQFFGAGTGWTCVVPKAVWSSGGPLGCFCAGYCGNGGMGANPNTFSLGLTQTNVTASYGGGQAGNKTGWLCGSYRGAWSTAKKSAKVKK
jgi:hypothetical protein